MRIALYDVDSKIPNLALMKISEHYKQQGHTVERFEPLWMGTYDKVFASTVFSFRFSEEEETLALRIRGGLFRKVSLDLDGKFQGFYSLTKIITRIKKIITEFFNAN